MHQYTGSKPSETAKRTFARIRFTCVQRVQNIPRVTTSYQKNVRIFLGSQKLRQQDWGCVTNGIEEGMLWPDRGVSHC